MSKKPSVLIFPSMKNFTMISSILYMRIILKPHRNGKRSPKTVFGKIEIEQKGAKM